MAAARMPKRAGSSGKRKRRTQEQRWASMAGPVTVRRFDPQTGEAIED